MKKALVLIGLMSMFSFAAGTAHACWDNTDKTIKKMKKLDLTTEQLKDVFQYQKSHRELITQCHRDGSGCAKHERAEVDFQKNAYGVLDDKQFQKATGRERNEVESLRFENYRLKKANEKLKKELALLKASKAKSND